MAEQNKVRIPPDWFARKETVEFCIDKPWAYKFKLTRYPDIACEGCRRDSTACEFAMFTAELLYMGRSVHPLRPLRNLEDPLSFGTGPQLLNMIATTDSFKIGSDSHGSPSHSLIDESINITDGTKSAFTLSGRPKPPGTSNATVSDAWTSKTLEI